MGKFTILGNPAKHSKSPALFAAAYGNRNDLIYSINEPATATEAMAILKTQYDGGNITAPFKEDFFHLADELSETAKLIEAVNTVLVTGGKAKADNCDHQGVAGSFEKFKVSLEGKSCLLLGIGGAGKAAAYAICKAGGRLTIVNRTKEKAENFARKLNCKAASTKDLKLLLPNTEIIINTLYHDVDLIYQSWLNPEQVVLDASYIGSTLLEKAKALNCTTIDGRYWLYYQALYCFELFTGIKPNKLAMRQVLGI